MSVTSAARAKKISNKIVAQQQILRNAIGKRRCEGIYVISPFPCSSFSEEILVDVRPAVV